VVIGVILGITAMVLAYESKGLLIGEAADPDGPEPPGLVVLDEDWDIDSMTPGVEHWLAELSDADRQLHGPLPAAVLSVAGRALRSAVNSDPTSEIAFARVLSRSGRWIVLDGASLESEGDHPTHPARRLHRTDRHPAAVSPHTVQQHLKNIFDKTGVRDLAALREFRRVLARGGWLVLETAHRDAAAPGGALAEHAERTLPAGSVLRIQRQFDARRGLLHEVQQLCDHGVWGPPRAYPIRLYAAAGFDRMLTRAGFGARTLHAFLTGRGVPGPADPLVVAAAAP
jgi:hypothetical protein